MSSGLPYFQHSRQHCCFTSPTASILPECHLQRAMSVETITTISPITNKPVVVRNGLSDIDLQRLPATAVEAFNAFRKTSLDERKAIVKKAMENLEARKDQIAKEITEQMGRPIAYTAKEVSTAVMRGNYLLKVSDEALAATDGEPEKGFKRYIKKVPVGPVLILFPWNVRASATPDLVHG